MIRNQYPNPLKVVFSKTPLMNRDNGFMMDVNNNVNVWVSVIWFVWPDANPPHLLPVKIVTHYKTRLTNAAISQFVMIPF